MKKYFLVAKDTCEEMFVYRLNFIMWRVRQVLQFVTLYYLWLAILPSQKLIGPYTQTTMLTYILLTGLINSFVFSSKSIGIGDEIVQGNVSNFLLRPINYFFYWVARDVGDKALNVIFASVELTSIFLIIRPPFFLQTNPFLLTYFVIGMLFAIANSFLLNFLLGTIGFWSTDVWGVRFLYMIIIQFFSGGLFPLDLLPKHALQIFQILPFSYLLFLPVKIYLGQVSSGDILFSLGISFIWIIIFRKLVQIIWQKGLRLYTAEGR